MNVALGFDLNCFSNRYVEPEAWTDFVASCGVRIVQFNFDLIDFLLPYLPRRRLVDRTRSCCRSRGIRLKCAFGGHNHHQNYLGHPDDDVATAYEEFYRKMADLTAELGAEGFGTCFAIAASWFSAIRSAAGRCLIVRSGRTIGRRVCEARGPEVPAL